jgi:hypothetical protein
MLVHAAQLVTQGVATATACRVAVVEALSDDESVLDALHAALDAAF